MICDKLSGAAYHCQQAAEKLVKAVLAEASRPFPKTHDIAALVGLVPASHHLRDRLRRLEKLTPYGVAYRYPAEDEWDVPAAETIESWKDDIEAIRRSM